MWQSITTNILIFENILSKSEQKITVARYQTCSTSSTEGSIHRGIWKNLQPPTILFLHDTKNNWYWIAVRHYIRYRSNTNNKLTFFQIVLVFSDGKQSFKPCLIVLFGALLLCLDTNNPHADGQQYRVQRSLAAEALNHWMAYKEYASASYVQLIGRILQQGMTTI